MESKPIKEGQNGRERGTRNVRNIATLCSDLISIKPGGTLPERDVTLIQNEGTRKCAVGPGCLVRNIWHNHILYMHIIYTIPNSMLRTRTNKAAGGNCGN